MEGRPEIGTLIVGCWLIFGGVYFSLGLFFAKYRGRWGRRGQGARMSQVSQMLWSLLLILIGTVTVLSACHVPWADRAFPIVFFPCFAGLFLMGWYDNRDKGRDAV